MLLITEKTQAKYRVAPIKDDGGDITFRFHYPYRPTGSDLRVTALELKALVVNYMAGVIGCGLLLDKPRCHHEFVTLFQFLTNLPDTELDQIHNWIFIEKKSEEDYIVQVNLRGVNPFPIHKPHGLVPGIITA